MFFGARIKPCLFCKLVRRAFIFPLNYYRRSLAPRTKGGRYVKGMRIKRKFVCFATALFPLKLANTIRSDGDSICLCSKLFNVSTKPIKTKREREIGLKLSNK